MKKVTRKDVAQYAGVSETIVSYVINNNRYVDSEKRKRVEEAIQVLGYTPNFIARSLKGKNSYHILFIVDQIENEHFGKLVKEMDRFSYEKGYLISLCANRYDDKNFVSKILSRNIDGIIINSVSFAEEDIERIISANIPVVLFMNIRYKNDFEKASKIYTGLYDGIKQAVELLVGKGCRNLIYIDRISQHNNFSTLQDFRLKGFLDTVRDKNLPFDQERIITKCTSEDEVIEQIVRKIKKGLKVDGVVSRNDNMAILAMKAANLLGLSIGKDIKIVGFDNTRLSRFIVPSLTTIEVNRQLIAKEAVDMLCHMIAGGEPYEKSFTPTLIERETT